MILFSASELNLPRWYCSLQVVVATNFGTLQLSYIRLLLMLVGVTTTIAVLDSRCFSTHALIDNLLLVGCIVKVGLGRC